MFDDNKPLAASIETFDFFTFALGTESNASIQNSKLAYLNNLD